MTKENGRKSDVLREIHVPILPFTQCNNIAHYAGRVHLPSMICAGYTQGVVDSCQVGGFVLILYSNVLECPCHYLVCSKASKMT